MSELTTVLPPPKPTTALTQDICIPTERTRVKSTENYFYTNQITQVNIHLEYRNSMSLAFDRLHRMELTNGIYDFNISSEIFDNTRETLLKLFSFLEFLDPEEIGPSSYDTILCNFEKGDKSLLLDIGNKSIAYIFSDLSDQIVSKESNFDDPTYWSELVQLFTSEFKNG